MKTSSLRRSIWIGVILIGGFILLPEVSVQNLGGYGFGLLIPGLLAVVLGLYGLCDAFELLGIDSRPDPPQLVSAIAILASVALVLYGLFLILPWGLVTFASDFPFRLVSGLLAIGIGLGGWMLDWQSSGGGMA